jgi:hypothetical protein
MDTQAKDTTNRGTVGGVVLSEGPLKLTYRAHRYVEQLGSKLTVYGQE